MTVESALLSVVVPVYNEAENVGLLVEAVRSALGDEQSWELLLVDDGSADGTVAIVEELAAVDPRVRLVALARNYGQTQAMQAGFDEAAGDVVVSMDGDLQNDPRDIPLLVAKLREGYDLVAGYRVKRRDRFLSRKVPSWVANRIIRAITKVDIRDNGCSLKAYRRWTLDRMALYSDMHRFLPALAAATAGARITEIPVRHHSRRHGRSKYGLSRILKILADLFTITLISWFREQPLRLFGLGAISALLLSLAFGVATALALLDAPSGTPDLFVLPGSALLFLMLAGYLLMLGLLAEMALRKVREDTPELLPIVTERSL
jgi:glycosyltransferase involved in cell wall biosynthesis